MMSEFSCRSVTPIPSDEPLCYRLERATEIWEEICPDCLRLAGSWSGILAECAAAAQSIFFLCTRPAL